MVNVYEAPGYKRFYMNAHEIANLSLAELHILARSLGNTPLEALEIVLDGVPRTIHLKMEGANPTGSAKDRTCKGLMQDLERRGVLNAQSVIIESTSGNLGVALSFWCRINGYRFLAIVDPKTTQENLDKMRALGAEIEIVTKKDETHGYLLSRLERVRELCASSEHYIWPNQYENLANPHIHYTETGPEIYRQMNGNVDALFIAVSTGGTLMGISQFFRRTSRSTRIIGVDAHGSVIFGMPRGPRLLTGIGSSRTSAFINSGTYDASMLVSDAEAFHCCRALLAATDLCVGGSSGAVVAACVRYLRVHPEARNIVCVCPDQGENYSTSIYNDAWMAADGFSTAITMPEGVETFTRMKEPYYIP